MSYLEVSSATVIAIKRIHLLYFRGKSKHVESRLPLMTSHPSNMIDNINLRLIAAAQCFI